MPECRRLLPLTSQPFAERSAPVAAPMSAQPRPGRARATVLAYWIVQGVGTRESRGTARAAERAHASCVYSNKSRTVFAYCRYKSRTVREVHSDSHFLSDRIKGLNENVTARRKRTKD